MGAPVECSAEAAEVVALECGGAEMRGTGENGSYFLMFCGDDLSELVGHVSIKSMGTTDGHG